MVKRIVTCVASMAVVAFAPLNAQKSKAKQVTPAPIATGSIEGDVYLVMKSGDTKRAAGRVVLLVRDVPPGSIRAAIDQDCWAARKQLGDLSMWAIALVDTERKAKASAPDAPSTYDVVVHQMRLQSGAEAIVRSARESAYGKLGQSLIDSSGTGINAHYSFSGIRAGTYALFSEWPIGAEHYAWYAQVTVAPGAHARRDLDNTAIDQNVLCAEADSSAEKMRPFTKVVR